MRVHFVLYLTVLMLSSLARTEPVNYASVKQGARIDQYSPAHRDPERVTGSIAIGGGEGMCTMFQSGVYPQILAVDLGQVRTIKNINIQFRRSDYTGDQFKLEYAGDNGKWYLLKKEIDWAQNAKSLYQLVLDVPIKARRIRFTGYKTGFPKGISTKQQKKLRKAYGDSFIINHISAFAEEDTAVLERSFSQIAAWIDWELVKIKRRGGTLDAADSESLAKLETDWKTLAAASLSSKTLAECRDLLKEVSNLSQTIFVKKQDAIQEGTVAAGWLTSLERTREDLFETNAAEKTIELKSARNEYENAQIVLFPTADFENVTINLSPLTNERGDTIAATNIKTFDVRYIQTLEPTYEVPYVGKYEDILRPATVFSLKTNQVRPVLLDIHTPADAKPGKYTGVVSIRQGDRCLSKLNISLDVWNFTLPTKIGLPNVHSLSLELYKIYYQTKEEPSDAIKRKYYDFMIEHRLNPTNLYVTGAIRPKPELRFLKEYAKRGMNAFNIGRIHSPGHRNTEAYFQRVMRELPDIDKTLKDMNLTNEAFIYLTDEPPALHYPEIIRRANIINATTDIRLFAALNRSLDTYPAELLDACDIICPVSYQSRDEVVAVKRKGKEAWWYIVGWGFNVDQIPLRTRMFPWIAWWYNVDGVMQWILNTQWRCDTIEPGLPPAQWKARTIGCSNGLGNYMYPGADGMPLPSLRLKNYRDGLEDYEYFLLLSKIRKQNGSELSSEARNDIQRLLSLEDMVHGPENFCQDRDQLTSWRNAMGSLIHSIRVRH